MKKTNRELNTEHVKRELLRVRPKQTGYDFAPLEEAIRKWQEKPLNE
jgi:hypothetical protein